MSQRIVVIGLSVLAVVLLAGVVVYAFGTPQAPAGIASGQPAGSPVAAVAPQVAGDAVAEAPARADGVVPEPDPGSPLAIQIPGCTCHSDDPQVVEEHAQYRMNQCFGCHADGVPEMDG